MFGMKVIEKMKGMFYFHHIFVCNCYSFWGKLAKFSQAAKSVMLCVHFPSPLELSFWNY